jgi:hypothetical protein
MKNIKILILGCVGIAVFAALARGKKEPEQQLPTKIPSVQKLEKSTPMPRTSMKANTPAASASKSLERLRAEAPSLVELHRYYVDFKLSELEEELARSRSKLRNGKLIEASNSGTISEQDQLKLIYEIRKQAVVNQLIVNHLLDGLKRRSL